MKERPILFSPTMVQAILANQKTQTRRVIKPQPVLPTWTGKRWVDSGNDDTSHYGLKNPFSTGDRLWVRETHAFVWHEDYPPENIEDFTVEYRADTGDMYPGGWPSDEAKGNPDAPKWRPSIFMPKWAARIWIEIVNERVERIQDISDDDIYAEGTLTWADGQNLRHSDGTPAKYPSVRYAFRALWDSINAKRGYGWDKNPWVWVLEFRRIEPFITP